MNLKNLYLSCEQYAESNGGTFPNNLSILVEDTCCPLSFFVNPKSGTKRPNNALDVLKGQCDYYYFGAGKRLRPRESNKGKEIILSTKPENYPSGFTIIVYDGFPFEVMSETPEVLKKLIELKKKGSKTAEQPVAGND